MAKVLRIHSVLEDVPEVAILDRHVHDFETPFLTFSTLDLMVGGNKATVLISKLDVKELEQNVYLRTTWMRESVCGYLSGRAELVDVSRSRLVLAPTLLRHLGDKSSVIIVDEIFLNEAVQTTHSIQAVLNTLRQELGKEGLLISLDWTSYMEFVNDKPPHPSVYAERCGFLHTGLMWIERTAQLT